MTPRALCPKYGQAPNQCSPYAPLPSLLWILEKACSAERERTNRHDIVKPPRCIIGPRGRGPAQSPTGTNGSAHHYSTEGHACCMGTGVTKPRGSAPSTTRMPFRTISVASGETSTGATPPPAEASTALPLLPSPPPCQGYAKAPNQYGPYAYCSLDKAMDARAQKEKIAW